MKLASLATTKDQGSWATAKIMELGPLWIMGLGRPWTVKGLGSLREIMELGSLWIM